MAVLILLILIDKIIGYGGWSVNIGMPIVVGVANITMFVLTIVSRKRYFKYSLYQIMLSILSIAVIIILIFKAKGAVISASIVSGITVVTLILSICLCGKDLKEKLYRVLHI